MVRGWKFWIWKVNELYCPCSENKGADQLRSYREADLLLCFSPMQIIVFPMRRLSCHITFQDQELKVVLQLVPRPTRPHQLKTHGLNKVKVSRPGTNLLLNNNNISSSNQVALTSLVTQCHGCSSKPERRGRQLSLNLLSPGRRPRYSQDSPL